MTSRRGYGPRSTFHPFDTTFEYGIRTGGLAPAWTNRFTNCVVSPTDWPNRSINPPETQKAMNIKEHIDAGHYPLDSKGRALVPRRDPSFAPVTVTATDGPPGYPIQGFGLNYGSSWTADGMGARPADGARGDLMPPKARTATVKVWAVVHDGVTLEATTSLSHADRRARNYAGSVVELTREIELPWS